MSVRELTRVEVLSRVKAGTLSVGSAATLLAVSYRQAKRLAQRYRTEGAKGLTHRSAGGPSNPARPPAERERALALVRAKYGGSVDLRFGPTRAAEHVASEDGIMVHHDTWRRWMLATGVWSRARKRLPHRQRRERKPHFGEFAGGVMNRVEKEAGFQPLREVSLQGGMYGNKRVTADVDQPVNGHVAFRLNGMFERSDSFRNAVDLKRYGVAPSVTIAPSSQTKITLRYQYLRDTRVADRGIPSFQGRPADVDVATYCGNPDASHVKAHVNLGSATVEHRIGGITIRNQTLFGDYDRFYQNFVPGEVTADQSQVSLSGYNNETARRNLFNQTDVTSIMSTGRFRHTLLAGTEFGRQLTDNFRNTGFFNNAATSILLPYGQPTIATPVTFRQGATDADNHLRTNVAAAYGQDQIELSRYVQVIAGLRFDRFDLQYHNNRTGDTLVRPDNLVSPRAGVVLKPIAPLSVYGSYSVSYVPSSGDQFSSLTTITQQVEPEKLRNYEAGAKWDAAGDLSLTTAVYRLDRTNTRSTDPNDPTRIIQTGSQRTNGYELGVNGRLTSAWSITGGYAYQDAFVSSATTAARAGAQVGRVPHHTLSLWNNYQVHPRLAAGIGIGIGIVHRSDMFAAIDDTVTLPGYTRADAAAYVHLTKQVRLQANVENVFDKRYYINADSNTNISPGFPRTLRIALTTTF